MGKQAKPKEPDEEHCYHYAAPPWKLTLARKLIANEAIVNYQHCCRHGEGKLIYLGFTEEGHGPFVEYIQP